MEWDGEASGDAAEHCDGGDGEGSGTTSYVDEEYYAFCNKSDGRVSAVGEHAGAYVHVLRAEGTLDDGVCGEISE